MNTCSEMDTAISAAVAKGRALWPEITVPVERFSEHVREIGADHQMLHKYGADLYFACACTQRDQSALRLFHSRVLPTVDRHVARLGMWGAHLDELHQDLCVYLLADRHPRIAGYAGRGPLLGWLRTVAARRALAIQRAKVRQRRREKVLHDATEAPGCDPERGAMKRRFGPELQRALQESLSTLTPQWKAILRMHYLDGLHIETICEHFGVHRATVFRWFSAIRAQVMAEIHARLAARLTPAEVKALIDELRDELHINIDNFLEEHHA